jgi:hypothetical protein
VVFTSEEAVQHLAPVLTPQELKRVRAFLDEYPAPHEQRPA